MAVSRSVLVNLAKARASTIANATHYLAEIPATPPTISDDDLRVRAYTVLWPAPGGNGDESDSLTGLVDDVDWRFTISCVAGIPDLLFALIDQVDAMFNGWWPTIAGLSFEQCVQDFDPGQIQRDDSFAPDRFFLQLPYRFRVGA